MRLAGYGMNQSQPRPLREGALPSRRHAHFSRLSRYSRARAKPLSAARR